MRTLRFLPLLPVLLAVISGCDRDTDETVVVVPPAPTPTPATEVVIEREVLKPVTRPDSNSKTVVVAPPKKNVEIVENRREIVREVPATPQATPRATPRATKRPTTRPTPRPTTRPATRPTSTPIPTNTPIAVSSSSRQDNAAAAVVRGEVIKASGVPATAANGPDALVFVKYRVLSTESGRVDGDEILVAQWGVRNKKLTSAARLRAGDVRRLQLMPLSSQPNVGRAAQYDDTGDTTSRAYFATG